MLFLLHLVLEGVTEGDNDPKERSVSFKVTTSNESSVCAPSGYSTREQLARWRFFEGLQKYMQFKNEGNENEIMLGNLNCTMDKIDRDAEKRKHKDFIGAVPIMPCKNSSWIMGLRIYGERRTQIPPSSSATIGPLLKISIDRPY